jgi:hypothetical protein
MRYNDRQHAECLYLITHEVDLSIHNFQEVLQTNASLAKAKLNHACILLVFIYFFSYPFNSLTETIG